MKHESAGLPKCPGSCTDSEERREGKITTYQDGFGCIFIELHPCIRRCARRVGISLSPRTPRVGKPIVLVFTSVVGRTSMLTVVCTSCCGLGGRGQQWLMWGVLWKEELPSSQLCFTAPSLKFPKDFQSSFFPFLIPLLHSQQMTSVPT